MKLKKKLIGFVGLIIMIIIPLMSLNIEQLAQATTQETEIENTPESYSYDLGGFSYVSWNLQYRYEKHDICSWWFTSTEKTIDVSLLTHTEFAKFESLQSYTYWELSTEELAESGDFVFPEDNSFYLLFENNHFFGTYLTIDRSFDQITADISYMNIAYIDNDNDGYDDDFTITFKIKPSHFVSFSFYAGYEIHMERTSGSFIDSISDTVLLGRNGITETVNFEKDYDGLFKITLRTFYDYYVSLIPEDDIETLTTNEIYAEGHAEQLAQEERAEKLKFYGLYIALPIGVSLAVIVSILVPILVIRKKRKASLIKP